MRHILSALVLLLACRSEQRDPCNLPITDACPMFGFDCRSYAAIDPDCDGRIDGLLNPAQLCDGILVVRTDDLRGGGGAFYFDSDGVLLGLMAVIGNGTGRTCSGATVIFGAIPEASSAPCVTLGGGMSPPASACTRGTVADASAPPAECRQPLEGACQMGDCSRLAYRAFDPGCDGYADCPTCFAEQCGPWVVVHDPRRPHWGWGYFYDATGALIGATEYTDAANACGDYRVSIFGTVPTIVEADCRRFGGPDGGVPAFCAHP